MHEISFFLNVRFIPLNQEQGFASFWFSRWIKGLLPELRKSLAFSHVNFSECFVEGKPVPKRLRTVQEARLRWRGRFSKFFKTFAILITLFVPHHHHHHSKHHMIATASTYIKTWNHFPCHGTNIAVLSAALKTLHSQILPDYVWPCELCLRSCQNPAPPAKTASKVNICFKKPLSQSFKLTLEKK